ncbi:MAG: ABC transporter substrate-binding protein [Solirubrobacterales bacterium]
MRSKFGKRLGTSLAALVLLGGAIAGCGGDDESSDDSGGDSSGEPVEITFWHGQTQGPAELLQQMIDDFNKTHPDVVVSKDSGGVNSDRMLQKVTAGLQADNYPDIAYIYGSDLANLAQGEQLVDLTSAIDDGQLDWDRFVDAGTEAVTVDDKPRAVPAFIDNLAVVYNKKIFDDAGVPYPTDDWTWDDFLATAAELNDPDAGIAGFGWPGTGDEDTTWRIWPLVWQQGGDIVNEDGSAVGFDGASGEAALEVVAQAASDGSVYIDSTAGSERMQQLFASGKMAMNVAGPYTLPEYVDAKVDYGVVSMPSFGDEHTTIAGPDTWAIFDNGDERVAAAIEFMDWFSEPEQQLRWITEAGSLPLTTDVEDAEGYSDYQKSLPGLEKFIENTDLARTRATVREYPQISQAMGKAVASVLYGEADPSEALSEAVDTANSELQVPGP